MSQPSDKEKRDIMSATVQPIIDLLNKRLKHRVDALNALTTSNLDSIPESVKKMREEEAAKIRAVLQEQSDLIDIIKTMYPDAK